MNKLNHIVFRKALLAAAVLCLSNAFAEVQTNLTMTVTGASVSGKYGNLQCHSGR